MASVRKKPGSQYWFACYTGPDGRAVQRSTRSTDKATAQQIAHAYEKATAALQAKRWNQQAALQFLNEMAVLSGVTVPHAEPVADFLDRWLDVRGTTFPPVTREKYRHAFQKFKDSLSSPAIAVSEIGPEKIAKFRDSQAALGKSPGTVNKYLMFLAQAFDEAVSLGAFVRNPARGLNLPGERRNAQKRRPFTFEQFRQLVSACTGEWRTLVLVCGYTGARQQEAAKLKWSQVDGSRQCIVLKRSKTGDRHPVPIHPTLFEHLQTVRRSGDYLMPDIAAMHRRAISNNFRRQVLPLIGIEQAYSKKEGRGVGRRVSAYSLHGLRHGLNTWLASAGVEERVRMLIVGHQDKDVSRSYTHSELSEVAGELAKVAGV